MSDAINYKDIGKRIKIARIRGDITQEKLAEAVNISSSHLSNIETGNARVSLPTLVHIANALDVLLSDLLCDTWYGQRSPIVKSVTFFSPIAVTRKHVLSPI